MAMKKTILSALLLGAAAFGAAAQQEHVVDFYFMDPASVTLRPDRLLKVWESDNSPLVQDGTKNNYLCRITGMEVVSGGVVMTATKGEGAAEPRFFWGGGTTDDTKDLYIGDFRVYKKNTLEFNAPEGCKITQIVMHPKVTTKGETGCCDKIKIDEACGGTQKITGGTNSWTAPEGGASKVTYTVGPKANTQVVYRLYVTLSGTPSSINTIEADDSNAPVEYYNISGMRCDADNLTPGIYVRRQGARSMKIVVR